jgi:hypothetical protein
MVCVAVASLLPVPTRADEEPRQVPENPFVLAQDLIVPGTTFTVEIAADPPRPDAARAGTVPVPRLDVEKDRVAFWLSYPGAPRPIWLPAVVRRSEAKTSIEMRMPGLEDLPGIGAGGGLRGVVRPYGATLVARIVKGELTYPVEMPVQLPSVRWAWGWGLLAVAVSLGVVAVFAMRRPSDAEKTGGWPRRFLLAPLALATTPVGGYSLSLTQILFWSCITIFGLVYVYFLTSSFLAITTQMLVLLGISGGTAVAHKILSDDAVMAQAMKLAGVKVRSPKLRDLIWSVGGGDVFKFQMLVFTVLTGFIVLREIVRTYAFPDIPENLVALMGVSSSVYVGNKVVQRGETDDVRESIKKKLQEIGDSAPTADAVKSLKGLVTKLYPESGGAEPGKAVPGSAPDPGAGI